MVLSAAGPDYFPLQPGNQWVYRVTSRSARTPVVVQINGTITANGHTYYRYEGFPGAAALLRQEGDTLYAYDQQTQQERVWTQFNATSGQTVPSGIDACSPNAVTGSNQAKYEGPIGSFTTALEMNYPPSRCADAGLTRDLYLPYVGLVQRTVNTIAGPTTYDLIYARLGGVTVISEKELTVSLALSQAVYTTTDLFHPRLTLRSTQDKPILLEFPSGQRYDLVIRNEQGETVYTWSSNKLFAAQFSSEEFGPGERNYVISVERTLPVGKYTAEAWLTTTAPIRYRATVGFEVQAAPAAP